MKYLIIINFMLLQACGQLSCQGLGCKKSVPQNILVIGDSISTEEWGYFPTLQRILSSNGYTVNHIPENARSTVYTSEHLNEWLSQSPHDTIIWNNGIWDCIPQNTASDEAAFRTTPEQYATYIQQIGSRLKSTGERVIFVTTTEIPGGTACEVERNQIASSILTPMGVEIIDLYSFTKGHAEWHGRKTQPLSTDVHYTSDANIVIGGMIAGKVLGQ